MSGKELAKRYLLFTLGLIVICFGAALSVKADLGISPITAVPYALSLVFDELSMGMWCVLFCVALLAVQLILLRGKVPPVEIVVQLGVGIGFGSFMDLGLWCLRWLTLEGLPIRLVAMVINCAIIAVGVWLEVIADVAMMPADAFVRAIVRVADSEFGKIKLRSDVVMAAVAGGICLICLGRLGSVGLGTVFSALTVGPMVRVLRRAAAPVERRLLQQK